MPEGIVVNNVKKLLDEAGKVPMDLVRDAGLSPTTAYNLYHDETEAIYKKVLAKLCGFFTKELGRPIGPGDILSYLPQEAQEGKSS